MSSNTCLFFFSGNQTFFSKDFFCSCKPFPSPSQQDNLHLTGQHHLGFFQTFLKSLLKLDNLPFYLDKEGFFDLNIYRLNSIAPNSNFKIKDFNFSLREKGFNMGLEENSNEFSQIANATSPNPNINRNSPSFLVGFEKQNV